ncbi:prohibitin 4 [Iris pallida]|uniref:Prohibitin 4 n=1 Tax=Iris pallida TaxID=29817 RepID=A0AAX6GC07_IRIPA|nr:prohibitin 4 [Iris pallida]
MHHVGGYYDLCGETQIVEEDDEVIRGVEEWVETQAVDDHEEARVLADDGVDMVQVAMFEKKGCTWSVLTSRPLVEGRRRFWWKMGEWVPQRMATMASPCSLHGGDPPRKAHGSGTGNTTAAQGGWIRQDNGGDELARVFERGNELMQVDQVRDLLLEILEV